MFVVLLMQASSHQVLDSSKESSCIGFLILRVKGKRSCKNIDIQSLQAGGRDTEMMGWRRNIRWGGFGSIPNKERNHQEERRTHEFDADGLRHNLPPPNSAGSLFSCPSVSICLRLTPFLLHQLLIGRKFEKLISPSAWWKTSRWWRRRDASALL